MNRLLGGVLRHGIGRCLLVGLSVGTAWAGKTGFYWQGQDGHTWTNCANWFIVGIDPISCYPNGYAGLYLSDVVFPAGNADWLCLLDQDIFYGSSYSVRELELNEGVRILGAEFAGALTAETIVISGGLDGVVVSTDNTGTSHQPGFLSTN